MSELSVGCSTSRLSRTLQFVLSLAFNARATGQRRVSAVSAGLGPRMATRERETMLLPAAVVVNAPTEQKPQQRREQASRNKARLARFQTLLGQSLLSRCSPTSTKFSASERETRERRAQRRENRFPADQARQGPRSLTQILQTANIHGASFIPLLFFSLSVHYFLRPFCHFCHLIILLQQVIVYFLTVLLFLLALISSRIVWNCYASFGSIIVVLCCYGAAHLSLDSSLSLLLIFIELLCTWSSERSYERKL